MNEFKEGYVSDQQDPMDGAGYDFDWGTVYADLDREALEEGDRASLCSALRVLLDWIIAPTRQHAEWENTIARRALAMCWVVNPGMFSASPSLTELAKRIGIHKATLSTHAADARRFFRIFNRGQQHGWNFKPGQAPTRTRRARPREEQRDDATTPQQLCLPL